MNDSFVFRNKLILVMGMQRSGTTALLYTLGQDPSLQVENEMPGGPIYDNYRLRPESEIRQVLWKMKRRVILKPVVEIEFRTIDEILDEFIQYDPLIVWIYRDPVNVWSSALQTFNLQSGQMERWIDKWVKGNRSAIETLKGPYRESVAVVRYEDLIEHREVFDDLCRFLDIEPRNNLFWREDQRKGRKSLSYEVQQHIGQFTEATLRELDTYRIKPVRVRKLTDSATIQSHFHEWQLNLHDGCEATLKGVEDGISELRVDFTKVLPGKDFGVQLAWEGLSLYSLSPYSVSFWARAERPRRATLIVSQNHEPWESLGVFLELELDTQWRPFSTRFSLESDEPRARIHLDLAQDDASIELSRFTLGAPSFCMNQLDVHARGQGRLEPIPGLPCAARIHVDAAGDANSVQLIAGYALLEKGEHYSIVARVRADCYREIAVSVGQDQEPWKTIGVYHIDRASNEWRDIRVDFEASESGSARLFFDLAQSVGFVDVAEVRLFSTLARVSRVWTRNGAECQIRFPAERLGSVKAIIRTTDKPEPTDVQLFMNKMAVAQDVRYAVSFMARADRPRNIGFGVQRDYEPWLGLGVYHEVGVSHQWKPYYYEFVSNVDETHARIVFDVGQSGVSVEISDVQLEPAPTELTMEDYQRIEFISQAFTESEPSQS